MGVAKRPKMKSTMAIAIFLLTFLTNSVMAFDHEYQKLNALLSSKVEDGLVDYSAIKKNPQLLNDFLREVTIVNKKQFQRWDRSHQLAFIINLYNATTIKLIVDNV